MYQPKPDSPPLPHPATTLQNQNHRRKSLATLTKRNKKKSQELKQQSTHLTRTTSLGSVPKFAVNQRVIYVSGLKTEMVSTDGITSNILQKRYKLYNTSK